MNASLLDGLRRPRRLTGVVITIMGFLVLVGVPFVPLATVVTDPGLAPFPERFVAFWLLLVGLALTAWPSGARS